MHTRNSRAGEEYSRVRGEATAILVHALCSHRHKAERHRKEEDSEHRLLNSTGDRWVVRIGSWQGSGWCRFQPIQKEIQQPGAIIVIEMRTMRLGYWASSRIVQTISEDCGATIASMVEAK